MLEGFLYLKHLDWRKFVFRVIKWENHLCQKISLVTCEKKLIPISLQPPSRELWRVISSLLKTSAHTLIWRGAWSFQDDGLSGQFRASGTELAANRVSKGSQCEEQVPDCWARAAQCMCRSSSVHWLIWGDWALLNIQAEALFNVLVPSCQRVMKNFRCSALSEAVHA